MNDKTKKDDATGTLWVVNYKYVHKNGAIRSASITATCKEKHEAEAIAETALAPTHGRNFKIVSVKPW